MYRSATIKKTDMTTGFKTFALYIGGTIGVGIFGIPYALMRSGFWPMIVTTIVVLIITYFIHLFALDIVLMAGGRRQLPGYIGMYLGKSGKYLETIAEVGGSAGALLAYLIVGGGFLHLVINSFVPASLEGMIFLYFIIGAGIVFWGKVGHPMVHSVIFAFFMVVLGILIWYASREFSLDNFTRSGNGIMTSFLLPYGVLLFAFWGVALIPELVYVAKGSRSTVKKAIGLGFIVSLISYVLFSVIIVGVSGVNTTEDAIGGLIKLGGSMRLIVLLGSVFGVLTTFSSFLSVGRTLKRMFIYDYKFSALGAWLIAMGIPILFFLLGVHSFVKVLGVTGAIFLGLEGLLIIAAYWVGYHAKTRRHGAYVSKKILSIFIFLLFAGVIVEIMRIFNIF